MKLVSIAMTTYNGEQFLREQLDSIYSQTYTNIEVIVCDDCSSDATVDILREYEFKHGLKVVVNQKNLGYAKNFEKAISLCSGTYIALCDQDDIWLPTKIEVLTREIVGYSMIYSDASLIDDKSELIATSRNKFYRICEYSRMPAKRFLLRNYIMGCTSMFRRDIIENKLEVPNYVPHDWWVAILAIKRDGIRYFNDVLIQYRLHESQEKGIRKKRLRDKLTWSIIKEDILSQFSECSELKEERSLIKMILAFKEKPLIFRWGIFLIYWELWGVFFTKSPWMLFRIYIDRFLQRLKKNKGIL